MTKTKPNFISACPPLLNSPTGATWIYFVSPSDGLLFYLEIRKRPVRWPSNPNSKCNRGKYSCPTGYLIICNCIFNVQNRATVANRTFVMTKSILKGKSKIYIFHVFLLINYFLLFRMFRCLCCPGSICIRIRTGVLWINCKGPLSTCRVWC